jgi:hypothetical protein
MRVKRTRSLFVFSIPCLFEAILFFSDVLFRPATNYHSILKDIDLVAPQIKSTSRRGSP